MVASGTEVELALKVQEKLKESNIHSKVVSMPCMELFDKQPGRLPERYFRRKFINHHIRSWKCNILQKYIKNKGANLGIDKFGAVLLIKKFTNILNYQRKI